MRDSDRIKPCCDKLATIWGMVPDWRLGQFMENVLTAYKLTKRTDPFYVEDEEFLKFLYDYISRI